MVGFPLLLIPLAIYNIIVFLMPAVSLSEPVLRLTLMSGAEWPIALGDMLLAFAALMLLCEVIKGARPGAKYLTDHLLSLIVFGGCGGRIPALAEIRHLDLFPADAVCAGRFPRGRVAAQAAWRGAGAQRCRSRPQESAGARLQAPAAEPQFEPPTPPAPPAAPKPSAASVAESVLLDHPEPSLAQQPAAAPRCRRPASSRNGAHPQPDTPPR